MPACPTLVIILPHLVWQWVSKLRAISSKFCIYVYFGDACEKPLVHVLLLEKLSAQSAVFEDRPENNSAVVITSYQTLNSCHGPGRHAHWMQQTQCGRVSAGTAHQTMCPSWGASLDGLFRLVILDEAHMLRNSHAHISTCI